MHVAFKGEIIHNQHYVEKKRLDAYVPKYRLGIEVDEYDHKGSNPNYEQSRQLMIEGYGITVIRTNRNREAPNCINRLINQQYMHIIKSTKKQTEKSLADGLSKRLLELKFAKKTLNKIKVFKRGSLKNTATSQRMKNTQSKIKQRNKTWNNV